jgi:hypothetical protein
MPATRSLSNVAAKANWVSSQPNSDAFQRREKASEDYAIRLREKEKLLALRKQLKEQQAHLQRLSDHMYAISPSHPDTAFRGERCC